MARLLFILGAGASAHDGCPCMSDFLDRARTLRTLNQFGEYAEDYDRVEAVLQELQQTIMKSRMDTQNLETVFSAVEMALVIGRLGSMKQAELQKANVSLLRVIEGTLLHTQKHTFIVPVKPPAAPGLSPTFDTTNTRCVGPLGYAHLADLIAELKSGPTPHDVDVLTFNYDAGLETALEFRGVPYNDLSSEPVRTGDNKVRIAKPHGSLNWENAEDYGSDGSVHEIIRCHNTTNEMSNLWNTYIKMTSWETYIKNYTGDSANYARLLQNYPSINHEVFGNNNGLARFELTLPKLRTSWGFNLQSPNRTPIIVPPSDNKSEYRKSFMYIWQQMDSMLSEAECVFVIGYSLPQTDYFFRQFFALASVSKKVLRRFYIFDRSPRDPISRFQDLLSEGAIRQMRGHSFGPHWAAESHNIVSACVTIRSIWEGSNRTF